MSTADLQARLETRLAELTRRDAAIQGHLRGQDGRHEADFSDRVAFTEMDEVLEQLDDTALAEIRAIRGALARIDAGEYGTCARCGGDIDERRLEVMPHTAMCVGCAGGTG